MADLKIFQKGDKVKAIITSQNKHLDMEACDFYVEIVYGMRGNKLTIQKSDMLYGTDGEYVMVIDTVCHGNRHHTDGRKAGVAVRMVLHRHRC